MALTNISLRIYGGVLNNGFNGQPIVAVGTVPTTFKPVPPTIVNEQYVWMITHTQDYTYYAVYSTHCRTTDDQPGHMLICLFFPPQMRLAEGNSPLGLLDSLTDCFAIQALRDGKLPEKTVDNSPFKALLGKYRLEQRPVALPVMSGHEPAAFCVSNRAQLDALLRHSRYPVLAAVGTLELGFNCTSTIQLFASGSKTSAPRPKTETQTSNPNNNHAIHKDQPVQPKTVYQNHGLEAESDLEDEQPNSHKKLKVFAICAAIIIVLIIAIVSLGEEGENQQEALDQPKLSEAVEQDIMASDVEENTEVGKRDPNLNDIAPNQPDTQIKENEKVKEISAKKKAEIEAKKKAEIEAKKKAEIEAKKKAEIEAKKKREAENSAWQASIRSKAVLCPIQLRVGVHITSITYTNNSVTFTVKYDELSKYNLYSEDRDRLASDRSLVLTKYASGLPSGVSTSIVQKDKAGRTL